MSHIGSFPQSVPHDSIHNTSHVTVELLLIEVRSSKSLLGLRKSSNKAVYSQSLSQKPTGRKVNSIFT
ncbi:hypothetical protein NPIL_636611 [Nephila pilipes]|uniref:Uncharacterized protein n=1 Tax=Nephila pilipes TaxID=299642 RepID=A0A8X6P9N0_NEPPI|nr:hypothetical protein NPIL_636611 [Nephila pilipes]